jgi:5-methylthioadenosine/S-adenosylhomocysteine deaminase
MQQILLKNCNLIPVDPKKPNVINNIDILISEGKIKNIAKNIKAKDAKIIDCTNKYITPGFINCHTHIPMSLFRELPGNYKLQD